MILLFWSAETCCTSNCHSQDLNVKTAEEVTLVGRFLQEYSPSLVPSARRDLQWLAESLLLVSRGVKVEFSAMEVGTATFGGSDLTMLSS